MSVFDFLFDLFGNEEARTQYADHPEAYTAEHLPEGVTGADVLAAIPAVCGALPPEQASALRTAYGIPANGEAGGGSGGASLPPPPVDVGPPPAPEPGDSDLESVLRQVNYYTNVVNTTNQTYEDNDTTVIDDRDTNVDNSVNQNITAFGDVEQTFDNDVASGDGAIVAGDGSQNNTGDGAFQAGGNVTDSTVATGDVGGSVTGDNTDSIVGDGNQAVVGSTVDDSAIAFGGGDAINDSNVNEGDGVLQSDVGGDANAAVNSGSGDQVAVQDSTLDDSNVAGGDVSTTDINISADDGGAVAFGAGSSADGQNVNIDDSTVDGNVQVAGDYSDQTAVNDESVDNSITDNSVDNSINDSFDDQSVDASVNDSFDDNPVDASVDASVTDNSVSDDDAVDVG
jgi:hypothetical protein